MENNKSSVLLMLEASWGEVDWVLPVVSKLKELKPNWEIYATVYSTWKDKTIIGALPELLQETVDKVVEFNPYEYDIRQLGLPGPDEVSLMLYDPSEKDHYDQFRSYYKNAKIVASPHTIDILMHQEFNSGRAVNYWEQISHLEDLRLVSHDSAVSRLLDFNPTANLYVVGCPRLDLWWIKKILSQPSFHQGQETQISSRFEKIFTFTTSNPNRLGSQDAYEYTCRSVIDSALEYSDSFLFIKPHPRQPKEEREILEKAISNSPDSSRCLITNAHTMQLSALSDLVISTSSGTILDSLAIGKPVIEFSNLVTPIAGLNINRFGRLCSVYEQKSISIPAHNKNELESLLSSFFNKADNNPAWEQQRNTFLEYFPPHDTASAKAANTLIDFANGTLDSSKILTSGSAKSNYEPQIDSSNNLSLKLQNISGYSTPACTDFISELRTCFNLEHWISTGSCNLSLLDSVGSIFNSVTHIESAADIYQINNFKNFNPNSNINISNSAEQLGSLIKNHSSNCLIWLSTHDSTKHTYKTKTNTPVIEELKVLKKNLPANSIICVDNTRYFQPLNPHWEATNSRKYPNIIEAVEILQSLGNGYRCTVLGNILLATPLHAEINVSKGLESLSASRLYMGELNKFEEIVAADSFISTQLQPAEIKAIFSLVDDYCDEENFSCGAHYLYWKGLVLYGQGDYLKAYETLIQAENKGCRNANHIWFLALASWRVGNLALVQEALRFIVPTFPNFIPAQELINEINSHSAASSKI